MSLHDFTGWIPEVLIFQSGGKDEGLLSDVEFRWQSLQIPVTSLKNDLWTLSQACKPVGQRLLSCSVPTVLWRAGHFYIGKHLVLHMPVDADMFFQFGLLQATENCLFCFISPHFISSEEMPLLIKTYFLICNVWENRLFMHLMRLFNILFRW